MFAAAVVWPVIYDTLYAMVDRDDDLKVGIHSTAILLGQWDRLIIALLEIIWLGLWLWLAQLLAFRSLFYDGWLLVVGILIYEWRTIRKRAPKHCFRAFLNHAWIGGILWFSLVLSL